MRHLAFLAAVLTATPASAELIFIGDRPMSVAGHRVEGDRIVVALRGGGEMSFDRALVTRIAPDEVPHDRPMEQSPEAPRSPAAALLAPSAYDPLIQRASERHGVDARLVKAVIHVESAFQPRARSRKGAMGLMQLMPKTARQYQARNPYDPGSNIEAGTKYLRTLLDEFDLPLALAAYNAGEGAVRRFGGIPPYAETRAYVTRILTLLGSRF